MSKFLKQFIFVFTIIAILTIGGLAIYSATPQGKIKVNPILGHDLDLNAKYYGQAANNTVHDITTEDISISAWVKVDVDAGAYQGFVAKFNTSIPAQGFRFRLTNTNKLQFSMATGGTEYAITGSTAINDNKWHYVSAIIDRDTNANCKLFIDGIDNTNTRSSDATLANITNLVNVRYFYVGAVEGTEILDGQIRDVKLYYAAGDHWTDAQVLYQAQHPFDYTANAGTLTDYWRLDEGTGTTLYGKVNNLTLSNVLAWTTQPKIKMVKQENTTTTGNNPVGWWKMDEGTGQYAYDASGNGNTGTLGTSTSAEPADPTWASGKLGKGLSFDGVRTYVGVSHNTSLNFTNAITVSGWIKLNNKGSSQFLVDKLYYSPPHWGAWVDLNGAIVWQVASSTGYMSKQTANSIITWGVWHHIAITQNGYSLSIYADGVSVYSATLNIAISETNNSNALYIGRANSGYYANGFIDDIRIYNRALSAGEVAQMYNSTKDGYLGNVKVSTGLVGYWKLDDNAANSTVIDYSGKRNNGTAYSGGVATNTSVFSSSTAMVGRAMSFDGVDDRVDIPNFSFPNNAFTYSAWFKPTLGATQPVYASLVYQYQGHGLLGFNSAILRFMVYDSSNVAHGVGTKSLNTTLNGAWHYAVGVMNGSSISLYIDGVLDETANWTFGSVKVPVSYSNIGAYADTADARWWFNGLIDSVKIWNRALTAEEINQQYQLGLLGKEQ